jgi:hypothetical protein
MTKVQSRGELLMFGETAKLKRKTGSKKYEKGIRKCSHEEDKNMLLNL